MKSNKAMTARLLSLFLIIMLCISTVHAASINKTGEASITFRAEDFASVMGSGDRTLEGIVITALPQTGFLTYGGRVLFAGEAVTAETLNELAYMAASGGTREVSFAFLPMYSDGSYDEVMTVSLTMQAVDNNPPMSQDVEVTTYKNTAITGAFRANDPEGDALTFRVTAKPKRGEVEVTSDGRFVYTPYHNKTGSDTFSYVAVDAYGNLSQEAKVSVKIEKPASKTTYADMEGHPAQYAALRLCAEGVYTGQQMCGEYYFRPNETVSRAEMITMVVKAMGMEVTPVAATGFYDDADMPVWFKPYAQAALKAGIISGVRSADGRTVVVADTPVTLSQAATILNHAISPVTAEYTQNDAIPAWSAQAIANLDAAGVFEDVSVTSVDQPLTRAEVAMLLVKAMDAQSGPGESGGLLSWVFGW